MNTQTVAGRPGRNEPCHCGSGKKYKHCCLEKDELAAARARAKNAAAETPAPAADAAVVPAKASKHKTAQPWKGATNRGFAPRSRTPRKMGGG